MTEYVFKAADSESAMDKAVRELGDDAMILSIRRVGSLTEVRAIKQTVAAVSSRAPEQKPPRYFEEPFAKDVPAEPLDLEEALRSVRNRSDHDDIDDMYKLSFANENFRGQPYRDATRLRQTPVPDMDLSDIGGMEQILKTREPTKETTNTHLMRLAPGEPPLPPRPAEQMFQRSDWSDGDMPAPSEDTSSTDGRFGARLDTKSRSIVEPWARAGSLPTQPAAETTRSWANARHQTIGTTGFDPASELRPHYAFGTSGPEQYGSAPTAVTPMGGSSDLIVRRGFPEDIAWSCAIAPELHSPKAQLDHACKLLAERLAWPDETSPLHDGSVLFIFGPPGAGKTTIAAQIAFERIQSHGIRPKMIKLFRESFVHDGRLQYYALLLNTGYTKMPWHQPQSYSPSDLVDCDFSDPDQVQQAYDLICLNNEHTDVTPVMIVPGTWSDLAVKHYCQTFKDLAPATILTHMNIGGIGIGGLSALSSANARLVAVSETQMITDGLEAIDQLSIEQFLLDKFTYNDAEFGLGF